MIVILKKDVKGLGKAGEIVKVSDGHARNLLLPKGFATEATEGNVRNLEKAKALNEEKKQKEMDEAKTLAAKIESQKVILKTKGGEGGKLFGSITSKDIAEALEQQHKVTIDKKKFVLESPIKHTGSFQVDIKLYTEITAKLTVVVEI
ncbi:MAG: 50S ribosomal protein L9 [Anaerovorax sp.]